MDERTPQELFQSIMDFKSEGTAYKTLGGIWPSCFERWRKEGMPADIDGVSDLIEHFGLMHHTWTAPEASVFVYPPYEYEVIDETEDKVTYVNHSGITCTEFKDESRTSMPHWEKYPVEDPEDWPEYRERLQWDPARVGESWEKQAEELQSSNLPVILYLDRCASLYGSLRDMVGVQRVSLWFYDEPELVREMMDTVMELFMDVTSALFDGYVPDAVCMWEDMAYRNGPLLGAPQVREFMLPRYQEMTAHLRDLGVPYIFLDSDGDVESLIPVWLEADIDGVVPMEVQSGMNVAVYRDRYPELRMMGGIDKKALAAGGEAIDREMEKVERAAEPGGYIPWFDHGLPHDVSWDSFVHFVDRLKSA